MSAYILGIGAIALDNFLYVDQYPPADTKARVKSRSKRLGGLCATALITAARLGIECQFAGHLGVNEDSEFAIRELDTEKVGTSCILIQPSAGPSHSTIIIDTTNRTRTVFSYRLEYSSQNLMEHPGADIIEKSAALLVDHTRMPQMIRAATIARDAGVPVVADLERNEDPDYHRLLHLSDHLILSREFALHITGETDVSAAIRKLREDGRKAVVLTAGSEGCWYLGDGKSDDVSHFAAYPVDAIDTTGCGDVFHGAYAVGLVWELDLPDRIRYASACAALKAQTSEIPDKNTVNAFLSGR